MKVDYVVYGVILIVAGLLAAVMWTPRGEAARWATPWNRWLTYGTGALLFGLVLVAAGIVILVRGVTA